MKLYSCINWKSRLKDQSWYLRINIDSLKWTYKTSFTHIVIKTMLYLFGAHTHCVQKRRVVTKYTYSVTFIWVYFWKVCTFKSRFKSGYFILSTFQPKKNCTFTWLHWATFLSLLNFNAIHVKKRVVYSMHAVSFFLGHEWCLIHEWITLLSDSVQGLHQTICKTVWIGSQISLNDLFSYLQALNHLKRFLICTGKFKKVDFSLDTFLLLL